MSVSLIWNSLTQSSTSFPGENVTRLWNFSQIKSEKCNEYPAPLSQYCVKHPLCISRIKFLLILLLQSRSSSIRLNEGRPQTSFFLSCHKFYFGLRSEQLNATPVLKIAPCLAPSIFPSPLTSSQAESRPQTSSSALVWLRKRFRCHGRHPALLQYKGKFCTGFLYLREYRLIAMTSRIRLERLLLAHLGKQISTSRDTMYFVFYCGVVWNLFQSTLNLLITCWASQRFLLTPSGHSVQDVGEWSSYESPGNKQQNKSWS